MHYHSCPECYEHWECNFDCTIELDLSDLFKDPFDKSVREFGSHCTCPDCDKTIEDNAKYQTKEFWDVYNGFVKVREKNV